MTEREKMEKQFIELLKRADTATKERIEKCLILFRESSGFNAAFEEATPPGEMHPPAEVMRNLVNKWAVMEGI